MQVCSRNTLNFKRTWEEILKLFSGNLLTLYHKCYNLIGYLSTCTLYVCI